MTKSISLRNPGGQAALTVRYDGLQDVRGKTAHAPAGILRRGALLPVLSPRQRALPPWTPTRGRLPLSLWTPIDQGALLPPWNPGPEGDFGSPPGPPSTRRVPPWTRTRASAPWTTEGRSAKWHDFPIKLGVSFALLTIGVEKDA